MTVDLHLQSCEACSPEATPLSPDTQQQLLCSLTDWEIITVDGINRLRRHYKFKNFRQALAFTNSIGAMAEEQGHHPGILTEWGAVTVEWWSHSIKGLHNNDFVCAAKTDEIFG
ncbi:4a-hydroxytetrahydrobiopterin dehydratase [Vibrio sp. SCSIO 43136]|uniref:4a-hydroxytetrahydrobiopterin dehydratase n=1 Tax=Vibrio sp. SCSIO 43136 TaxID=2819101 RepID=UPI002074B768|nr:4a-hydroxytetrahydrobiopterin dehydratase [Vibrio sp. SCSIO 43136]USD68184.1 4a-hydroxytetrahydrobiopterin dehydratase [Vibrio sp. SCSIO 43136]